MVPFGPAQDKLSALTNGTIQHSPLVVVLSLHCAVIYSPNVHSEVRPVTQTAPSTGPEQGAGTGSEPSPSAGQTAPRTQSTTLATRSATEAMIDVNHVTKRYGDYVAIEDVTFQVGKGEILGFLGPNGAGKTTTMRILTGYMPPSEGSASIAGFDIFTQSLQARQHIGYLPETVPLYTDMTVRGYLDFQATLHNMRNPRKEDRIDEVIERLRLDDYADSIIAKLSKGYRQRVGIAQAIIHEPDVLVLDEPTIGIDPVQVVETRQLIKDLGRDHTIILSSHILPEVSMVCQKVIIINEGQIVAMDTTENLSTRLSGPGRVRMSVRGPAREVAAVLRDVAGVQSAEWENSGTEGVFRFLMEARGGRDIRPQLAAAVVQRHWDLLELQPVGLSLEDIFLRLTTKEDLTADA